MTPSIASPVEPIPGVRKAAIFLMGVGDQCSASLLRQLSADEVRRISSEIAALDAVAPEQMIDVFREFEGLSASGRYFAKGGAERARQLVEHALGPDSAQHLLDPAEERRGEGPEVGLLQSTEAPQLASFLREEHPQTVALVLSNIPSELAGQVMSLLPEDFQPQVALRMATLDRMSPEVFRRIAEALGSKLKAVRQVNRSDGLRTLAGLLNRLEPANAESILSSVEKQNQVVVASVRNLMFVFEDILRIDKESIKSILARLDRKVLTVALKGTSAKIRGHFTQCMSQRASEMLTEDMEALGPVRIRDVEGAQQQVIVVLRQLQQEGVISVGSGGGNEYVV